MRTDYGTLLPSAVACFEDDFEALHRPPAASGDTSPLEHEFCLSASSSRSGGGSRSTRGAVRSRLYGCASVEKTLSRGADARLPRKLLQPVLRNVRGTVQCARELA